MSRPLKKTDPRGYERARLDPPPGRAELARVLAVRGARNEVKKRKRERERERDSARSRFSFAGVILDRQDSVARLSNAIVCRARVYVQDTRVRVWVARRREGCAGRRKRKPAERGGWGGTTARGGVKKGGGEKIGIHRATLSHVVYEREENETKTEKGADGRERRARRGAPLREEQG